MSKTNLELAKLYGNKVKEYRKIANLSQEKLAEICGCANQTIWGIESGYNSPSFNLMDTISKALKVPLIYFFNFQIDEQITKNEKDFMFNRLFNDLSEQDKDIVLRIITALNKTNG